MHLEIKHMRMVRMIAKTNNLTKAASQLNISQPALSQQLKDIENRLGTALFSRTGKRMILTRIGKNLVNHAKVVINAIEEAEREIQKSVLGETGTLTIGVRCLFCYKWIPLVVTRFQERYPNIDLTISNSYEPEKDLLDGVCDIAISTSPVMNPKISFSPLFEDEFLCTMSDEHPLSHKKYLDLEDFNGVNMIAMVDKSGPSFYDFFFKDKGIRIGRYMTITHPDAVVDLVEANLGIAILPRWFIMPYTAVKRIRTCSLTSKQTHLQWKASFLKHRPALPYQKDFVKLIRSIPIDHLI